LPGEATHIAREAALQGVRTVVAVGGDGTIHEVVNGIAGFEVALGILPLGTENVLAKELRVPFKVREAIALIARRSTLQIDLGKVGGRYFALVAGVGFDAQVVHRLDPYFKRQFGRFSFVCTGVATFPRFNPRLVEIRINDEQIETRAWQVLVSNSSTFAGNVRVAPTASITDGRFDVCVFADNSRASFLGKLVASTLCRRIPSQSIRTFQTTNLSIQSTDPLPVEIDGEALEMERLEFSIHPRALRVITGLPASTAPN